MSKDEDDKPKNSRPNSPWGNTNSDESKNDSKGKPQNPWSNDPQTQNLDDLARRIEDKLKNVLSSGGGGGFKPPNFDNDGRPNNTFGYILMGGVALWLMSGVYLVDQGEKALVSRFGKYARQSDNGLHFRLPSPIESHTIVNVQRVNTVTVGDISQGTDAQQNLMLTGDENIVNIGFQVFWRVKNAENFQFNIAHGEDNNGKADLTVTQVAEASMREVIGQSALEKVLTNGRAQVEQSTKELMQHTLDSYHSGIEITQVNLRKSEPPASVVSSFREVAAASQEAETNINKALSYRNSVVPQAQGEAARFNQIYQEYKLSPEVTRQRIYLETMEKIYERSNKIIVDNKAGGQMMVLPPDLLKAQTKVEGGK